MYTGNIGNKNKKGTHFTKYKFSDLSVSTIYSEGSEVKKIQSAYLPHFPNKRKTMSKHLIEISHIKNNYLKRKIPHGLSPHNLILNNRYILLFWLIVLPFTIMVNSSISIGILSFSMLPVVHPLSLILISIRSGCRRNKYTTLQ